MIKNEADILSYIQSNIKTKSRNVAKSIGDDCAVIRTNSNSYFVITTDTSLLGPHFTADYSPYEIGYKCVATNLSDIAAMGCVPKYIFMAITIPSLDSKWIKSFYIGIKELTSKHKVALIGGDTNKGPLSISIQVIGINKANILYRSGAKINDDIYVTGKLGNARAALMVSKSRVYKNEYNLLKKYLRKPSPRIDVGLSISKFANSCIDISDGLLKDLGNILFMSNLGADINIDMIPFNPLIKKIIPKKKFYECLIGGGEDYELCFTSSTKHRKKISSLSTALNVPITLIGKTTKNKISYFSNNKEVFFNFKGFDHFAS